MLASVTHIVLPIAPDLVSHQERGRAIGIVMTGLLLGILLARTFAGWVSHIHGWRYVFVVAAVLNASFVPLLRRVMPKLPPKQNLKYSNAMRSLWTLFRSQPLLRESSVLGALIFASFSCFWTTLAFLLDHHYGMGAGVAGTFGVVGAAGALIAPIAGRLADKFGSRWVISVGMAFLAASYLILWGGEMLWVSTATHMAILVPRRHRPRCRRTDVPGGQSNPHLRPGSIGKKQNQHRLHDGLLHRSGDGLGAWRQWPGSTGSGTASAFSRSASSLWRRSVTLILQIAGPEISHPLTATREDELM